MKIQIFGAGNIGGTLGKKWATQGHEVVFIVRDPQAEKIQNLLAEIGPAASAAPLNVPPADAQVMLFAIPGRVMAATASELGPNLNGKILIDATNNIGAGAWHSLDVLRRAAPDSPLFRAFSNLGWENFADPIIDGQQADLFYCGDSGPTQPVVELLISEVGLRPVYLGGLDQADLIDALTRLWFTLTRRPGHSRHLALKMLG